MSKCVFLLIFQQQNKEANDYIDSIAHQMGLAVEQCIEAAGHEFEPAKQKSLLRVRHSWAAFQVILYYSNII